MRAIGIRHVELFSGLFIYLYIYKRVLSTLRHFIYLPAARLSSCSRFRGAQGARPDLIRKFGPRPRSVARVVGGESVTSARGGIPST